MSKEELHSEFHTLI